MTNKLYAGLVAIAVLLPGGGSEAAVLACLGNSQMVPRAGYTTASQTLCALLAARTGSTFNNYAVSGAQTGDVLHSQLPAALANASNTCFVYADASINDVWYSLQTPPTGTAASTSYNNNIAIVQAIQARGKPVTMFSPYPFWSSSELQAWPAYGRLMRTVADGNGVPYLDWYTSKASGSPDSIDNCWYYPSTHSLDAWCTASYAGDVFHPNLTGNTAGAALCSTPAGAASCACNP